MEDFWNDRYSQDDFAYGKNPNAYVKEKLLQFKPGNALFPAEGEGRNAVYAAELGWQVSAFDFSSKGKEKADNMAASKGLSINYEVKAFLEESYRNEAFDLICLSYVHFMPDIKSIMHRRIDSYLKLGGHIIFEGFSKEHREINKVNPAAGGPPNADMMYSLDEIKTDFNNYEFIELKKELVYLNEGFGHVGESSVIRFVAKKKMIR